MLARRPAYSKTLRKPVAGRFWAARGDGLRPGEYLPHTAPVTYVARTKFPMEAAMTEPRERTPEIRIPDRRFPRALAITVVVAMVALAIFGSWGFATFGA